MNYRAVSVLWNCNLHKPREGSHALVSQDCSNSVQVAHWTFAGACGIQYSSAGTHHVLQASSQPGVGEQGSAFEPNVAMGIRVTSLQWQ